MSDWADETFNEIYRSILNDHLEVSKPLVLAALRKARADGIEIAASECFKVSAKHKQESPGYKTAIEIYHAIRAAADTLQHTEGKTK